MSLGSHFGYFNAFYPSLKRTVPRVSSFLWGGDDRVVQLHNTAMEMGPISGVRHPILGRISVENIPILKNELRNRCFAFFGSWERPLGPWAHYSIASDLFLPID